MKEESVNIKGQAVRGKLLQQMMSSTPSEKTIKKIVRSVIANQIALDFNEEIKHTVYYKQSLKNRLQLLIKELIKAEKDEFDSFISTVEDQTDAVYNVLYVLIKEIESLDFPDYGDIIEMMRAYKNDKKSIMGITRKVNKKRTKDG